MVKPTQEELARHHITVLLRSIGYNPEKPLHLTVLDLCMAILERDQTIAGLRCDIQKMREEALDAARERDTLD